MSPNEYQQKALLYKAVSDFKIDGRMIMLLEGVMGTAGEAGEALELVKKHIFQGHELDRTHLAKELGDVAWYIAMAADALGFTLDDILQMNIEKISGRYPDGYDDDCSIYRNPEDI